MPINLDHTTATFSTDSGPLTIGIDSAVRVPVGAQATRPGTAVAGHLRFDTDTNSFEGYDGTTWGPLGGNPIATQDEGVGVVADTNTFNFVGNGVAATDAGGGVVTVTISGAGISSTDDVSEGVTNLYFTDERVDDRVASLLIGGNNITLTYDDIANTLTIDNDISSTTDLPEGTNLYFTDERVDDRVNALLIGGTNITLTYDDVANTLTIDGAASGGGYDLSANDLVDVGDVSSVGLADATFLIYDTGTTTWRPYAISGDVVISDTGVATIQANSVALGTDTTGNYVATITGTANEVEVTGSGSETAAVTIGLPNDVTIGNTLTVTGSITKNTTTPVPGITVADTPPGTPDEGDFWYDTNNGSLYVYYTDATPDSYWVEAGGQTGEGTSGAGGSSPFIDTGSFVYYGGPRNVGIGTATPSQPLEVIGNIESSEDVIAYSDRRYKEDIETIDSALNIVAEMRGVRYTKKSNGRRGIGVIAQEVQKVLPEVVHANDEGMLSVAYGNIVGVLVEAVKEQKTEIDTLKEQMAALIERVSKLDGN